MLPGYALRSMRVMIATPCYASGAMSEYVMSMVSLAAQCVHAGLPIVFEMHAESLVTRGRNKLAAAFLSDPSLTHLFFIDADVGFSPDMFFRQLLADRDIACGVYPIKRYEWPKDGLPRGMTATDFQDRYTPYPFNPLPGGALNVDKDGFAEVLEAPTGFMCIKRSVFERLMPAYPSLELAGDYEDGARFAPGTSWSFFDTMTDPATRRFLSEDYAFCRRWRDIGGKVHIDADSKLMHHGQHNWRGDLRAHLEALKGA